ncbi:MAG TPA: hypothetical protein VGW38_12360, partial [Chloroflexota bacterium]|nr:hypothetical protein [Chloroflexota bacterium]
MDEFPQYVAAQLHCHSSIEGPASIGAHCYEAKRAGVDVVWLTDHDTRISLCIGGPFVDRFDFESPELLTSVERKAPGGRSVQRGVGWSIARRDERLAKGLAALTREQCYRGTQSLCLEAVAVSADASLDQVGQQSGGEWQYLEVEFKAEGKIHSRPLLSDVTIGIAVRLEAVSSTDAEAWLDLLLSEQPPDLRSGRLRYTFTPPLALEDDSARYNTKIVPLTCPTGAWVRHELRPADEAAGDGLGGEDNAITGVRLGVRVRSGGHVRLYVDDLTVTHQFSGDALHARQRALARELAATHGVVCHVAQEISQAGQHKNAWGEGVPLLDYLGQPSGFSHEEGVEWARRHNAVFSLNHPFSKYAKPEIDDVM